MKTKGTLAIASTVNRCCYIGEESDRPAKSNHPARVSSDWNLGLSGAVVRAEPDNLDLVRIPTEFQSG